MDSSRDSRGIECQSRLDPGQLREGGVHVHEHTTIAVDLAKSVFELAVSRRPGTVSSRRRLTRGQFSSDLAEQAPATIVMEACGSAHFWGREAERLGHRVVLLPPHAVRPYVLRNKTDGADARALLEALRNEALCPVPIKSVDQHLLAGLHRLRSGWMATRTARLNTIRGLLRELGVAIPADASRVLPTLRSLCAEDDGPLPAALRPALLDAAAEIGALEARIRRVEQELERLARESTTVERLRTIPGVGLLTATALVAFVGEVARFRSGRHFASYLGLTPRESSSGLKRRLGRISKRGDPYLRMLLIHGARSVLAHAKRSRVLHDGLRAWALGRERARGHNKAAVALANKLARIVWAVWRREQPFQLRREEHSPTH
jgi:transposase